MSEHSHSPSSGGYSIASLLGLATMIGVPVLMAAMLGITGWAFMRDAGIEEVSEEDATPIVVAAPAPAPSAPAAPAADTAGGDTPPAPVPAAGDTASAQIDPAVMELGKVAYNNCLACHGADGMGMKAGALSMAPALGGSELLLGDPDLSLLIVLKGIMKETADYVGVMAPLGAALDDEKLAAVLTYARNSFGNSAPAVTTEQAAAARAKFSEVPMNLSRSKIEEIVAEHQ